MREKIRKFLRWSEKYTGTDMVYLAEGGFWLTTKKGLGILASFTTSIAFANLLPEHTYGVYRYVLSILTILVIPTLSGIDTALTRAVAKGNGSAFISAFKTRVRWGLLGMLASFGLAGYYFMNGNTELGSSFLLAAVFIPVMDPANLFLAYLSGKKNFKLQAQYHATIRLVSSLLIIGVIFITDNILALLFVYFTSYTFLRLLFLLITKRQIQQPSADAGADTIRYGKHLTLMNIPGILSTTLDKILVFHYIGGAVLAGYYLALLPFKHIQNVLGSIEALALPNFALRDARTLKKTLPRKILKSYAVIIPVILVYWLLAPPFFSWFYPQYTEFVFISQVFMLQLLLLPSGLLRTAITAHGDKKKLYIHSTTTSIVRVLLASIFIPLWGAMGAALALIFTSVVGMFLLIYLFIKLK